ncbi:MAG: cytochrome c biogenesis heme-transporting ATPase CcmA [Pseudomonadota bacterium]
MFAATNLYCERDERVLFSHLDFSISAGEVLQVQGANGSGKTTLLRILCGLNPDYSGDITWQGQAVQDIRETFNGELFYLGHSPAINKALTPLQNLRWYCASRGFSDDAAIFTGLAELGLAGYENIPCHQMSAGQQRRVSLARLLVSQATLWILDEPFTALDKRGVAELEARIAAKAAEGGAVILTTHHTLQLSCPVRVINLDVLTGVSN